MNHKIIYTCPMHPEVTSDKPGSCPKCGMKLVGQNSDGQDNETALYPVMIGMPVNKEEGEDSGMVRAYEGKKYHLCCNGCVESFDQNPNQ